MTIPTLNKKEIADGKTYKPLGIGNTNMFPGDLTGSPDDFFIFVGGFL